MVHGALYIGYFVVIRLETQRPSHYAAVIAFELVQMGQRLMVDFEDELFPNEIKSEFRYAKYDR